MLKEWYKFFQENPSFGPILALIFIAALFFAPVHPQICPIGPYQETEPCVHENLISWLFNELDIHSGFLLALATGVIAWFTWTLKNASLDQGRLTERSVKVAESSLVDLEAPIVYCNISKPGIELVAGIRIPQRFDLKRGDLELCVYNFGRTAAKLTRIAYEITTAAHGGICAPYDPWTNGGRELPVGTVSVNGDPFLEVQPLRFYFQEEEEDRAIAQGRKSVWVAGYVRYDDIFGRHHINGFALVFDGISQRFVRRGGQKYNYERIEKAEEIPLPSSLN